jgi:UDP-3-O-[3-hydroxymyristoyl] glucosamine N-acyltransferase
MKPDDIFPDRIFSLTELLTDRPSFVINQNKYKTFSNFLPIDQADKNSIVYCSYIDRKGFDVITNTNANIVLAHLDLYNLFKRDFEDINKTILFYKNPKLAFIRILNQCFIFKSEAVIDKSAKIDPAAKIANNVSIGTFAVIGKCEIGANSSIGANTIIYDSTKIGENVKIGSSCDIGSEGFGFVKDDKGNLVRFPHIGGVIIEDDVEIFPFCDVSRGSLASTIIRRGAKLSFQVHIAHNCDIGKNCILTAAARVAGSAKIKENCVLGNGSVVRDKVIVGKNVHIGVGAVVVKDIPDNVTIVGNPAEEIELYTKMRRHFKEYFK